MITLQELIEKIRELFDKDEVNIEKVKMVLESYKSNLSDWKKYAMFDPHTYTRNLVDTGNEKYNMLILCWGPGIGSRIHDHTNAHCFVKVLDGEMKETKFAWPKEEGAPMTLIDSNVYGLNSVSYMCDDLGLHRMENPSNSNGAVTLHLYIPPYKTCNSFDDRTGQKTECTVTFNSRYGKTVGHASNQISGYKA